MSGEIPDRWLEYGAVGKRIRGTPFVAFKCPLTKYFLRVLPPEKQFGPNDLKTLLPNISLIIDLTNTDKYYSGTVFRNAGIEHEKILVPGHVLPTKDLLRRFFLVVDNFILKYGCDSINVIGVHCTHGVNRTGFFICSYMISKLKYSFESAVTEFNAARGHKMERPNYLQMLKIYETIPLVFEFNSIDFRSLQNNHHVRKTDEKRRKKPNTRTSGAPVVQTARHCTNNTAFVKSATYFRRNSYETPHPAKSSSTNGHNYCGIPTRMPYTAPRAMYAREMHRNRIIGHNNHGVPPPSLGLPALAPTSTWASQKDTRRKHTPGYNYN